MRTVTKDGDMKTIDFDDVGSMISSRHQPEQGYGVVSLANRGGLRPVDVLQPHRFGAA